jgi:hypothetical protein
MMKILQIKTRIGQLFNSTVLVISLLFFNAGLLNAQNQGSNDAPSLLRKGIAFAGFSGGASLRESENENALVATIQEQSKTGYNLIFAGGYMLKQEFAVGAALRVDQSRLTKTVVDSDGITSDVQEAGSIITSSIFVKAFIPLTVSKRINLYNIAGMAWVADRNNRENSSQDVLTRTYTSKNSLQLGVSPGIQVFIVEGFATEVGVNVAGFSATQKVVAVNGIEDSTVNTFDLDLRVNILSLNISFYYYFPIRKQS